MMPGKYLALANYFRVHDVASADLLQTLAAIGSAWPALPLPANCGCRTFRALDDPACLLPSPDLFRPQWGWHDFRN
jgi:hypothetical protein